MAAAAGVAVVAAARGRPFVARDRLNLLSAAGG